MANKNLFSSTIGRLLPRADDLNEAGGAGYRLEPRHALAQYVATGCMNSTFYASGDTQLEKVLALCAGIDAEFIARAAVYGRERGAMKDLPALLCAVLATREDEFLATAFERVIDTPRMLRNFVQILRSGVTGRKSLGSRPKRLVRRWLNERSDEQLFRASVGQSPSLADIVKMVHPKPATACRTATYAYLIGRAHKTNDLPPLVRNFEAYRNADDRLLVETPDVPFQMLTSLDLAPWEWRAIARNAPWQMSLMNLNTFHRHDVFKDSGMVRLVAERLRDPEKIRRARAFPYRVLAAYRNAAEDLPALLVNALHDALEISLENVPELDGKVFVFPDVSGSMTSPITGYRQGSSSAVRCVDVAALFAAAILCRNPTAEIIPFAETTYKLRLEPRDTVMTNAERMASLPPGGTNCAAPLCELNKRRATGDLVIYVSDSESWLDTNSNFYYGNSATQTMKQWARFKRRNPAAKMVCIDLQPYDTTQAKEREDITNVAGFSDQVFELLANVSGGRTEVGYWVRQIEAIEL